MLFRQDVLRRIGEGDVTLAFRRWRRPTVRPGGTLRTRVGVLAIDSVERVDEDHLTDADARRAGAADRETLLAGLPGDGALHRIEFRLAGRDARLARLDAASRHGPWTAAVLDLIAERPATRAPDLAASLGRETAPFKADVRKFKELALTESLEIGYRLSPRGRTYYGYRGVARKRSRSR